MYARLSSGGSRTFLTFTQTLLQLGEGLQILIHRLGNGIVGNLLEINALVVQHDNKDVFKRCITPSMTPVRPLLATVC